MMEKHKLDSLFSDKLIDLEQNPSPAAWDQLEMSLKNKPRAKVWPWLSVAASAALVLVSSWYLLTSEEVTTTDNYAYSELAQDKINIPVKVIFVPMIIVTAPMTSVASNESRLEEKSPAPLIARTVLDSESIATSTIPASENVLEHKVTPIIQEPLPLEEVADEIVIASTKGDVGQEVKSTQQSLTIIYKQGEPVHKSKFTQALNYMGEVRTGEKKLVNFSKIKKSFQSKLKSNKNENSK